jgi:hypothetical protein
MRLTELVGYRFAAAMSEQKSELSLSRTFLCAAASGRLPDTSDTPAHGGNVA